MRAVVQRVSRASVQVQSETIGAIGFGLLVLLAAEQEDVERDLVYTLDKVLNLRVFEDQVGRMNRSVTDVNGALLVVSQFTLMGDCRKGRRPSFVQAMAPAPAREMIEEFIVRARQRGIQVETGQFGADMKVTLTNDGPVTLLIDSRKGF